MYIFICIVSKFGIKKNLKKYVFFLHFHGNHPDLLGVGSEKLNLGNKLKQLCGEITKIQIALWSINTYIYNKKSHYFNIRE